MSQVPKAPNFSTTIFRPVAPQSYFLRDLHYNHTYICKYTKRITVPLNIFAIRISLSAMSSLTTCCENMYIAWVRGKLDFFIYLFFSIKKSKVTSQQLKSSRAPFIKFLTRKIVCPFLCNTPLGFFIMTSFPLVILERLYNCKSVIESNRISFGTLNGLCHLCSFWVK